MIQPYHHGDLRTALVHAAETILERDGIEALTLRAAAREAGVSHAAPTHHFGNLGGLLSALAASGLARLAAELGSVATSDPGPGFMVPMGRVYVRFARDHPGLFRLMFRSERLDWSVPALFEAGTAAFSYLTPRAEHPGAPTPPPDFAQMVTTITQWSLIHGLATLLLDGRLGPVSERLGHHDIDRLVEAALAQGLESLNPAAAASRSYRGPDAGGSTP